MVNLVFSIYVYEQSMYADAVCQVDWPKDQLLDV